MWIHKSEPDIYIGFSPALILQCISLAGTVFEVSWPPYLFYLKMVHRKKNTGEKFVRILKGRWDLAEWLERLAVSVKVATVLGSIPVSYDIVESEERQMKQCWNRILNGSSYMRKSANIQKEIIWRRLSYTWLLQMYQNRFRRLKNLTRLYF